MYRLTITQSDPTMPYIVADAMTLSEITTMLQDYKRTHNLVFFEDYDIIKVDEILVHSVELDNLDFSELEEQHD